MTPRRPIGTRRAHQLLHEMLDGADVLTIARRHHLSVRQVVAWARHPDTPRLAAALKQLYHDQTNAMLSRHRPTAAMHLAHLAANAQVRKEQEVQRRACLDMLAAAEVAPHESSITAERAAEVIAAVAAMHDENRQPEDRP